MSTRRILPRLNWIRAATISSHILIYVMQAFLVLSQSNWRIVMLWMYISQFCSRFFQGNYLILSRLDCLDICPIVFDTQWMPRFHLCVRWKWWHIPKNAIKCNYIFLSSYRLVAHNSMRTYPMQSDWSAPFAQRLMCTVRSLWTVSTSLEM